MSLFPQTRALISRADRQAIRMDRASIERELDDVDVAAVRLIPVLKWAEASALPRALTLDDERNLATLFDNLNAVFRFRQEQPEQKLS